MRLLLRGRRSASGRRESPAELLADSTLTLSHLDCPHGRIVLPARPAAECDLQCALCGAKTVIDGAQLLREVGRLLASETGTRAVVAGPRSDVVEITWEAPAGRRRGKQRDEGERRMLKVSIVVLVVLVSVFLLYGIYVILDMMGAFDSWKKEIPVSDVAHDGTSALSPLSRLNYDVQIVTPGPRPDGVDAPPHSRETSC